MFSVSFATPCTPKDGRLPLENNSYFSFCLLFFASCSFSLSGGLPERGEGAGDESGCFLAHLRSLLPYKVGSFVYERLLSLSHNEFHPSAPSALNGRSFSSPAVTCPIYTPGIFMSGLPPKKKATVPLLGHSLLYPPPPLSYPATGSVHPVPRQSSSFQIAPSLVDAPRRRAPPRLQRGESLLSLFEPRKWAPSIFEMAPLIKLSGGSLFIVTRDILGHAGLCHNVPDGVARPDRAGAAPARRRCGLDH